MHTCLYVSPHAKFHVSCALSDIVYICSKVVSVTTDPSAYIAQLVQQLKQHLQPVSQDRLQKEKQKEKEKKRQRGVADWGEGAYPGSRGCTCPPQEGGGQAGSPGQLPSPAAASLCQSEFPPSAQPVHLHP